MEIVICKHEQRFTLYTVSQTFFGGVPEVGTQITVNGEVRRVTQVNRDIDAGRIFVMTGKDHGL